MVKRSSAAEIFTHCSTGLGVRVATALPATEIASRRAPRLQITFMGTRLSIGAERLSITQLHKIGNRRGMIPQAGRGLNRDGQESTGAAPQRGPNDPRVFVHISE